MKNIKLLDTLEENKIIELGRGKVISKIEMNNNKGCFPVYSSAATGNGKFGEYGKYMFDDERITWSIDGGGKFFYREKHKYSVTNVCGWIKINNPAMLNTKYVYYNLLNQWKYLSFDYVSKAPPSKIKKVYSINIINLDKQKKIVNDLDRIQQKIDINNDILSNINELIKSQFIELFGDPINNTKSLKTKKLSELGEFGRGVSKYRPRNAPELLGGKYPLIQTGDVANTDLYITKYNSTYSELGLKQSKMWNKGTLCITIAANIANTAILTFDACFPDSVVGFNSYDEVDNIYIHYWFTFFQSILENQAPSVAQKNINLQTLTNLDVIVPKQTEIIKFNQFISRIDKLKFIYHWRYFL